MIFRTGRKGRNFQWKVLIRYGTVPIMYTKEPKPQEIPRQNEESIEYHRTNDVMDDGVPVSSLIIKHTPAGSK